MQRQVADGLILRSLSEGVASDRDNLAQFYIDVYGEDGDDATDALGEWSLDLMSGKHPTTSLDDIWVVVDPAEGDKIVSALLLIPQTWRYGSVELSVGRVELVATEKAYRRRGLVRELMNVAHKRSESLGHHLQSITGIEYFYRQFDYGMAIELGSGGFIAFDGIPNLPDDKERQFNLRKATEADIPTMMQIDEQNAKNFLLTVKRDEATWRFEFQRRDATMVTNDWHMIVNQNGKAVGYIALFHTRFDNRTRCMAYSVGDESSYLATFFDVMRGIQKIETDLNPDKPMRYVAFDSGAMKMIGELVDKLYFGVYRKTPYAWYLRVANMPRLIQAIAPVLEERLAGSVANRYTGELVVNRYRQDALFLTFEDGKMTNIEEKPRGKSAIHAGFAEHDFLSVIFGHRSIEDIRYIVPETHAGLVGSALLSVLFPKHQSWLHALG